MPIYEYTCEADGDTIELIRPMSAADDPVDDPKGLGRTFVRKHSTFSAKGAAGNGVSLSAKGGGGGCCPCGKGAGMCGRG